MLPPVSSMVRVTLSSQGVTLIMRQLRAVEERWEPFDVSPAWPAVRRTIHALIDGAFESEGGSGDEGAWPELAESTQRERARLGFPPAHPILQRTQKLRRSMTGMDGSQSIETADRLIEVSDVEYMVYHKGGPVIPRRWPATFTEEQRMAVLRPIRLWLTGRDPESPERMR